MLLLGALVIAAIFFTIGIFVGRLLTLTQNAVTPPQSNIEMPVKASPTPLPQ